MRHDPQSGHDLAGEVPRHGAERWLVRVSATTEPAPASPSTIGTRLTDLRSNEFRALIDAAEHEPVEHNPMTGYRGAFRYLREPDLYALELRVLAEVRERTPNLHLMLPFVRTRWELEACLELVDARPLGRQRGLHRWVMAEVPSVLHWLPEYVGLGIDGVSIGTNDLTQLILGVDRDSELCAEVYDETDPAVLAAITHIIETANMLGITSSLCGQSPSTRAGFVDHLVDAGITSISVNPDAIAASRRRAIRIDQRGKTVHPHVGDWLIVPPGPHDTHGRRGQIVELLHPDGTPPYRVRWLEDEHLSVVFPPPDAHLHTPATN